MLNIFQIIMSIPRLSGSFREKQESVSGSKVTDLIERRFRNHLDYEYSARVNVRSGRIKAQVVTHVAFILRKLI